jgi:hypothetical protein
VHLERLSRFDADEALIGELGDRLATVTDGARCFLAHQQERVVGSLLRLFPDVVNAHLSVSSSVPAASDDDGTPIVIAPMVSIDGGRASVDDRHLAKQPDWTYDDVDSGKAPADRLADQGG